jgi:hypothetical protein
MSSFIEDLEAEAKEQLACVQAFRTYQGANPDYKQKAKLAIGVIGAYVRLRATIANERTNELVSLRLLGAPERSDAGSARIPPNDRAKPILGASADD